MYINIFFLSSNYGAIFEIKKFMIRRSSLTNNNKRIKILKNKSLTLMN